MGEGEDEGGIFTIHDSLFTIFLGQNMLIIVHSLWGLTLATQTHNIFLLLLGGLGGHILLDAIPHRDLTTVGQVIIDIIIAATISLFCLKVFSLPFVFVWSVLFSTLPDVEVALRHYGKWKGVYFPSHLPSWHGTLNSRFAIIMNLFMGLILLMVFLINIKKAL
ncbi:MAG TPA: hypothetical protein DCY12_04410 [Candidatus Atribacteria bacterium]|nr:hypothetical protein [Candidatus Atribacteria bacterium]HCU22587.1 hypothetical protein [Candidatus Atribacteria bacterium]